MVKSDYVRSALKFPSLFYYKPTTLNKNIESSSKLLGLSKKDFIKAALKYPQLFYLKPEGLYKKSKLMHYLKRLKNEKGDVRLSSLTHKGENPLYREILTHLIYKQNIFDKLTKSQIDAKLPELLKFCQNLIT